jgi:cytochrome c551/c552
MKRFAFCGLVVVAVVLWLLCWTNRPEGAEMTRYLLPGDVKEGWKVFNEKKCSQCHSIWGEGAKEGPDLGPLPESYTGPTELVALLWNHLPGMVGKMTAKGIRPPSMDEKETANLFAFLYFIRYMDEPGNPEKGKALLRSKGCVQCHRVSGKAREDLRRWETVTNPIAWAQMMWNHAGPMQDEMKKREISRVEFKANEMVDLIAYIRSLGSGVQKMYLAPGDPEQGKALFTRKNCFQCHQPGADLDIRKKKYFPRTVANMAGTMWNHSAGMGKEMEERGIERPEVSAQEMSDLVAYLFSVRYFDEPGDADQGKIVFAKKRCSNCHAKGSRMPDLSRLKGQVSPIQMAQKLWDHGPQMVSKMKSANVPWQKFYGREMADLIEYLNRGMP